MRHPLLVADDAKCSNVDFVDFVDFDLIDRIVGVSPYRPQARTRTVILTRSGERIWCLHEVGKNRGVATQDDSTRHVPV
jgi:hypothetical protein